MCSTSIIMYSVNCLVLQIDRKGLRKKFCAESSEALNEIKYLILYDFNKKLNFLLRSVNGSSK
jgi:hypothetical protein